jgi:hypothetical protein
MEREIRFGEKWATPTTKNAEFQHRAISQMFDNLHEQKIIYSEHLITRLAQVEKLEIQPTHFQARVRKLHLIEDKRWRKRGNIAEMERWSFGTIWDDTLYLFENYFYSIGYVSWRVWTDPKLVQEVEKFMQNGEPEKAIFAIFGDKDKW